MSNRIRSYLNDTLIEWVNDYFEHVDLRIQEIYEIHLQQNDLLSFFYCAYITCSDMSCEDHKEQIQLLFAADYQTNDIALFLREMNDIFNVKDIESLKTTRFCDPLFKGQICEVPGDNSAKLMMQEMRDILKGKFLDQIKTLDQHQTYYDSLNKEYDLAQYFMPDLLGK